MVGGIDSPSRRSREILATENGWYGAAPSTGDHFEADHLYPRSRMNDLHYSRSADDRIRKATIQEMNMARKNNPATELIHGAADR